jgi:2-polyprenyl-6-methoxyphenol hydroxylase-like FAD-dependent oxidoreductase
MLQLRMEMRKRQSLSEACIRSLVWRSDQECCPSSQVHSLPTVMLRTNRSTVQDVPDENDPANWRFQLVTSWLGRQDTSLDAAGRLAEVKQKASDMCEPFRSAVMWIPDDTKITYNAIAYWVPAPWDNHDGRVTLAGDAAHPMTPRK